MAGPRPLLADIGMAIILDWRVVSDNLTPQGDMVNKLQIISPKI